MKSVITTPFRLLAATVLLAAAATPTLATDPSVQHVAMAYTKTTDVVRKADAQPTSRHALKTEHTTVAMAHSQRQQPSTERENDGSRFRYDSCGCSND